MRVRRAGTRSAPPLNCGVRVRHDARAKTAVEGERSRSAAGITLHVGCQARHLPAGRAFDLCCSGHDMVRPRVCDTLRCALDRWSGGTFPVAGLVRIGQDPKRGEQGHTRRCRARVDGLYVLVEVVRIDVPIESDLREPCSLIASAAHADLRRHGNVAPVRHAYASYHRWGAGCRGDRSTRAFDSTSRRRHRARRLTGSGSGPHAYHGARLTWRAMRRNAPQAIRGLREGRGSCPRGP